MYGLNFSTKEDAENFANSMQKVLEILNRVAQHNIPIMMTDNSVVINNNNQINQTLINQQQQVNQPVYAHLNETQQQIIKQQYQAPPEYSEVINTNNRTNGWTTQVQMQTQIVSQPNSLDLNDWRTQQQLQHDINQLNLNNLNGQQVQIMNSIQPIYGHHRNSLPNQTTNAQQMQQNAQLIQAAAATHQMIQTNLQISNGAVQQQQNTATTAVINQAQLNNLTAQQQTQPSQAPQMISQQTQLQPNQNINQQQLNNGQQSLINTNNVSSLNNNNNNNNSSVPPAPIPPPPPMPMNNTNKTSSSSSLNSNQQTGNSLASALANAKLKKTPNKDDAKESKPSLGGGMASMMDEMTRKLAKRRAQAEGNSNSNGHCNEDDNDSASNRLKNGWDNKNKSSPNKDNDMHSR